MGLFIAHSLSFFECDKRTQTLLKITATEVRQKHFGKYTASKGQGYCRKKD